MTYLGDYPAGQTVYFHFTTKAAGVPTTLSGSPVVSIYKNDDTGQTTTGVTLTADFDGVTGLNSVKIVTSDGFYVAGDYSAVITTGTVGGLSAVGYVVGGFSIANRSALRPATSGRTLVVDANGLADANMVKAGPSGSGTAQTAGDIIGDTNDIQARLPAALTANGNMKSSLVEILTTALTETVGQIAGGFKKFFNVATPTGTVNSLPDAAPDAAGGLPISDAGGLDLDGRLDAAISSRPSAADIADAVWDEATSGHTGAGSTGKALTDANNGATLDAAGIRSAIGLASANLDTQLGNIPTAAEINAEMVDALSTDTYTEPTGAPPATASLAAKISRIYQVLRNKITVTDSAKTLYDDAGSALWSKAVTDNGTTYTEEEGS